MCQQPNGSEPTISPSVTSEACNLSRAAFEALSAETISSRKQLFVKSSGELQRGDTWPSTCGRMGGGEVVIPQAGVQKGLGGVETETTKLAAELQVQEKCSYLYHHQRTNRTKNNFVAASVVGKMEVRKGASQSPAPF